LLFNDYLKREYNKITISFLWLYYITKGKKMSVLTIDKAKSIIEEKKLSDWKLSEKEINRQFVFKDFKEALAFVNKVGEAAEKVNHHPDILIEWNKVSLKLSTHDQGGLTEKDLNLAEKINLLAGV
jgi:4a-hydroxytetrahydrobiopterin dehydratase